MNPHRLLYCLLLLLLVVIPLQGNASHACDHPGNIRVVMGEDGSLEQVTHYYPFGGIYGDAGLNAELQPYKYNGKELDRMHGLDWYDYGARQYDAAGVPVFTTIDPMAEKYYHLSPYAYCANNPVKYVDLRGDSTRVYTEVHGAGHTWMSVGEGENMVVYSYGRYNGTFKGNSGKSSSTGLSAGDGVLLRFAGDDAKNFMEDEKRYDYSTFIVTDVEDETIRESSTKRLLY